MTPSHSDGYSIECEIGGCPRDAQTISPEGHVCPAHANAIRADYREAERRERGALR